NHPMPSPRDPHHYPDAARHGWHPASWLPLPVALLSVSLAAAAIAQTAPQQTAATSASPDIIKQREQELEAAREQQRKATELQEKLKAHIAAIGQDRSKLNQQLIDIAAQ